MSLFEALTFAVGLITAISVSAAARLGLLSYKYQRHRDAPDMEIQPVGSESERALHFLAKARTGAPDWLVSGVAVPRWKRYRIAHHGTKPTGPWSRAIRFDPPVRQGAFACESSCPDVMQVRFQICLESEHGTGTSLTKRIRLRQQQA